MLFSYVLICTNYAYESIRILGIGYPSDQNLRPSFAIFEGALPLR